MNWERVDGLAIPALEEVVGDSFEPTIVKITMEVTKPSMPEDQRIKIEVSPLVLKNFHQLKVDIMEEVIDHLDYDDLFMGVAPRRMSLELDLAELQNDNGLLYTIHYTDDNGQEVKVSR